MTSINCAMPTLAENIVLMNFIYGWRTRRISKSILRAQVESSVPVKSNQANLIAEFVSPEFASHLKVKNLTYWVAFINRESEPTLDDEWFFFFK